MSRHLNQAVLGREQVARQSKLSKVVAWAVSTTKLALTVGLALAVLTLSSIVYVGALLFGEIGVIVAVMFFIIFVICGLIVLLYDF